MTSHMFIRVAVRYWMVERGIWKLWNTYGGIKPRNEIINDSGDSNGYFSMDQQRPVRKIYRSVHHLLQTGAADISMHLHLI